jgi:hypothetical protein
MQVIKIKIAWYNKIKAHNNLTNSFFDLPKLDVFKVYKLAEMTSNLRFKIRFSLVVHTPSHVMAGYGSYDFTRQPTTLKAGIQIQIQTHTKNKAH